MCFLRPPLEARIPVARSNYGGTLPAHQIIHANKIRGSSSGLKTKVIGKCYYQGLRVGPGTRVKYLWMYYGLRVKLRVPNKSQVYTGLLWFERRAPGTKPKSQSNVFYQGLRVELNYGWNWSFGARNQSHGLMCLSMFEVELWGPEPESSLYGVIQVWVGTKGP